MLSDRKQALAHQAFNTISLSEHGDGRCTGTERREITGDTDLSQIHTDSSSKKPAQSMLMLVVKTRPNARTASGQTLKKVSG